MEDKILKMLYSTLIWLTSAMVLISAVILVYLTIGNPFSKSKELTAAATRTAKVQNSPLADNDRIEDGVHLATGLLVGEGFQAVRTNCTVCHSAKLITQNRATKEGWENMIRWMQQTQGLWQLGELEPVIVNYLATYYAPEEVGRRAALEEIEWYVLELEQ